MDTKIIAVAVVAVFLVAGAGAFLLMGGDADDEIKFDVTEENCLKIFGNSNGDYYLNDKDKEIIQDVIDNKKKQSELLHVVDKDTNEKLCLADADRNGTVDEKDIEYLDGIINRTNKTMNVIDTYGHSVTVPLDPTKVACDYFATAELLNLVGAQDTIVATCKALIVLKDYYLMNADTSKIVNYYSRSTPDYEKVNDADVELWVVSSDYVNKYKGNTTATVLGLETTIFDTKDIRNSAPIQAALLAGYIFDNVDKSLEFAKWYVEKFEMLNSKTADLKDDDKPKVLFTGYAKYTIDQSQKSLRYFTEGAVNYDAVELAGGKNLVDYAPNELPPAGGNSKYTEIEWIADLEYDFVFAHCTKYTGSGSVVAEVPDHGYTCNDPTEYKKAQADMAKLPLFQNCKVPEENCYLAPGDFMNGSSGGILTAMMVASVIHPDLFPDLDLEKEHQEFITMMGFDYDLSQKGVFFYPNA